MDEIEFNELIDICLHISIRFKRISKKEKDTTI